MMTDTIADFLTSLKNGYMAHKNELVIPSSKMKQSLASLLQKEGLIGKITLIGDRSKTDLKIDLIYEKGRPKVTQIVKVSKPGRKVYVNKDKIPKVLGGLGISVLSTSCGLMTDKEARKKKIGGEIICKIW